MNCLAWLSLPALVLVLAAQGAFAGPRQYDVEVIIFSTGSSGDDAERMSQPGNAAAHAQNPGAAGEFSELSSGLYGMNNIRGALTRSAGYRVLFHRAWRQLAYERAHAVDYPVHARADNGRESVEGTITLLKERYLHLDVDLRLMTASATAPALYADGSGYVPAFRLTEKRRIKSGELHYFDHPRFGLIARVTPYVAPDEPAAPAPDEETAPDDAGATRQEDEMVPADDQLTR